MLTIRQNVVPRFMVMVLVIDSTSCLGLVQRQTVSIRPHKYLILDY